MFCYPGCTPEFCFKILSFYEKLMTTDYSIKICKELEQKFKKNRLHRPMSIDHYDEGDSLIYQADAVSGKERAQIHLVIEKFVGGGFAGQVYKVKITKIENGTFNDLNVGSHYALKILIPPSKGSLLFRNILYGLGFQASFQLQTNPIAARSGAIWQKFIRRAAKIRFNDETKVNNIHATFVDENLGSCGELSDWVDGRTWRLEVDEHLDVLKRWQKGKKVNPAQLGSPEYRAKYKFMHDFVDLLHDIGAHEFARQYEWSTCKSQPNCLKRTDTENDPEAGLMAVDFRAGLTLLPFLPMSPGDIKLIFQGLKRGSLVQFDRGNLKQLESFVNKNKEEFIDMQNMLVELKAAEDNYRNSIPDITHNHFRLLFSSKLWSTLLSSAVTGWRVRNYINDKWEKTFRSSKFLVILFFSLGCIPFLGRFIRRIWTRPDWREHYKSILTSPSYLWRTIKGKTIEKVISWHRDGRVDESGALKVQGSLPRFLIHAPLSILPIGIHKSLTSFSYLKDRLDYYLRRPIRLYFNTEQREEWLREMVAEGEKKHIITAQDRNIILNQVNEPFIQKYLKSLAVHVCTVPVTQIVSVSVAIIYVLMHPEMPRAQAWAIGAGIIALFQVIPISPGSLVRGLYVLFLVIRERNFKDYNIAVFLGFFKYIGYLAFPIQMAYRYPVLARFMAGHWATEAVHIIPVFGEGGALLERWVYCLFYNWPLTIGRRIRARMEKRSRLRPRYWHVGVCVIVATAILGFIEYLHVNPDRFTAIHNYFESALTVFIPLVSGSIITLYCAGATFWRRIVSSVSFAILTGILYTVVSTMIALSGQIVISTFISDCIWQIFLFSIISVIGVIFTELLIPDPDIRPD